MGIAYPAVDPRRVLAMRADLVLRLLNARNELQRAAAAGMGEGEGEDGLKPGLRTVDRTRITSVEQLQGFLSRPMNG